MTTKKATSSPKKRAPAKKAPAAKKTNSPLSIHAARLTEVHPELRRMVNTFLQKEKIPMRLAAATLLRGVMQRTTEPPHIG